VKIGAVKPVLYLWGGGYANLYLYFGQLLSNLGGIQYKRSARNAIIPL
jgi:hypothetical protein